MHGATMRICYSGVQVKKDQTDKACGTYWTEDICIQNFCRTAWRKKDPWKTYIYYHNVPSRNKMERNGFD